MYDTCHPRADPRRVAAPREPSAVKTKKNAERETCIFETLPLRAFKETYYVDWCGSEIGEVES